MRAIDKMSENEMRLELMDRRHVEERTTYPDCMARHDSDPKFRALVDVLVSHMTQEKYTPGELRDAAFVAATKVESMSVRRFY